eukprot:309188-Heterocapsa_arctica.AAC.1
MGCWGEDRRYAAGCRPDGLCQRCFISADNDTHSCWHAVPQRVGPSTDSSFCMSVELGHYS